MPFHPCTLAPFLPCTFSHVHSHPFTHVALCCCTLTPIHLYHFTLAPFHPCTLSPFHPHSRPNSHRHSAWSAHVHLRLLHGSVSVLKLEGTDNLSIFIALNDQILWLNVYILWPFFKVSSKISFEDLWILQKIVQRYMFVTWNVPVSFSASMCAHGPEHNLDYQSPRLTLFADNLVLKLKVFKLVTFYWCHLFHDNITIADERYVGKSFDYKEIGEY